MIILSNIYSQQESGFDASQAKRPISDDDLIHCDPVYCPGRIGMTGRDTRAKLAIIKIWRGNNPKAHLLQLYPKCNVVGKAYVLAALWHFDATEFNNLSLEFERNKDPIEVMSADVGWSLRPSELVREMQRTNSTMAFDNPPLTREELERRIQADEITHYEALKKTGEWKKAEEKYKLDFPRAAMVGWEVEITRKSSKLPFTVDWNWDENTGDWHPDISIEEITAVIDEIDAAAFIQDIHKHTPLDIYLETESENFYTHDLEDDLNRPQENKKIARIKILAKAAGFSGTNKWIEITARSEQVPLILWHPFGTQFWLITSNLKISPEWCDAYKKQTGIELTDMETASGWAATCDNTGTLKMVRCPEAKAIEERAKEESASRAASRSK